MPPSELALLLEARCAEVLESMYFASVFETTPSLEPPAPEALSFSLSFAGDLHGFFGLSLSRETAGTLASGFLGEDEDQLTPESIADVVGELANIICGAVLSRIPSGEVFSLSHPEPVNLFGAAQTHTDQLHTLTLQTDMGPIAVWLAIGKTPLLSATASARESAPQEAPAA